MADDRSKKAGEIVGVVNRLKAELAAKEEALRRQGFELTVAREIAAAAQRNPKAVDKLLEGLDRLSGRDFPKDFEVTNLGELRSVLEEIAAKEPPVPPAEVRVSNLGEISPPEEIKVSGLGSGLKLVTSAIQEVLGAIRGWGSTVFKATVTGEVRVTNNDISEAIPVRLASRDLKYFYDAMVSVLGSGGDGQDIGILNAILAAIQAQSTAPATGFGDGTATIVTAGTPVQLPNQVCRKAYIQAPTSGDYEIVVGGATVVAAAAGRRGLALTPGQWQVFDVGNLNLIYLDVTAGGDGAAVNYAYET